MQESKQPALTKALGYCSVTTTGICSSSAPFTMRLLVSTTASNCWMTDLNRSWTSQTSRAERLGQSLPNLVDDMVNDRELEQRCLIYSRSCV